MTINLNLIQVFHSLRLPQIMNTLSLQRQKLFYQIIPIVRDNYSSQNEFRF